MSSLPDDPRFGKWGKQRCEDTGPLTKKRMENIDTEVADQAERFIRENTKAWKPWFTWFNTSRMHVWTSDNGAEVMTWPDGGTTPFKGEKNTNWEGGYRVPLVMRWPGVIQPGTEINAITAHEDLLPTFAAAAGAGDVKSALLNGGAMGGVNYKVHLDGYDLTPLLKAPTMEGPRKEFFYWTDDGGLACVRYMQWKIVFMEQRAEGFDVWEEPLVTLRLPKMYNLRADPFERAVEEGMGYKEWRFNHTFLLGPAQAYVGQWLQSFKDFPPRQKPGSFNLSEVMDKLMANASQ